jgi:uroporphyrinogen-III decarboxylase
MDDLSACGLNHMHPMEPAAGMDIVDCRRKYGEAWTFNGGLDKFAVAKGPDAIDAELDAKLQPELVDKGGIAFGLDHRIPNGTPIEHYRYYVRAARQRLGLPPADGTRTGWQPMAM